VEVHKQLNLSESDVSSDEIVKFCVNIAGPGEIHALFIRYTKILDRIKTIITILMISKNICMV
jgi:hypothetical protein